jgi:hypothetical protein
MKPPHPKGAILDLEDLQNLMILQFPVEVWDVDMNTIRERQPTAIHQGIHGLILDFKDGRGEYLKWYGFPDPTYSPLGVSCTLSDEDIDKAQADFAIMYMFNTREEATAAQKAYAQAQALKRKLKQ